MSFRSSGKQTAIKTSDRLLSWAAKCREGHPPKTKCVNALASILKMLNAASFSGSPTEDWLTVRRALEHANADELKRIANHTRYLRLLASGVRPIEAQFADLWKRNENYTGAEAAFERGYPSKPNFGTTTVKHPVLVS